MPVAPRSAPHRAPARRSSPHAFAALTCFPSCRAVSLHTIVRFNKMKRLCKGDAGVAAAALRAGSAALEVDPSGGSVRRLAPLPDSDPLEIGSRTVVAENLPGDGAPTVASLEALFAKAGRVRMLRVCAPTHSAGPSGKSTLQTAAEEAPWASLNVVSAQTHALVEYETRSEALAAVAQLNDNANWRTGLRVRLVRREAPAFTRTPAASGAKGDKAAPSETAGAEGGEGAEGADGGADGGDAAAGADAAGAEAGAGRGRKGRKEKAPKRDYAAWASVGAHRETMQRERAAAAAAAEAGGGDAGAPAAPQPAAAEGTSAAAAVDGAVRPVRRFAPPSGGSAATAPGSGPAVREAAMPDGTRGFTRGRGRPLSNPPL